MYQNIKPISLKAYEIFKYLTDVARRSEGGAVEFTRSSEFMPLHVEVFLKIPETEELVSMAHYGEQNGDAMRDPEMTFYHDRAEGKAYAMTFRDDYARTWEVSIKEDDNGRPWKVAPSRQRQHTAFAEVWIKNIKRQQRIK